MMTKAYECFISLSNGYGHAPFYVCRTQVLDRRSLRALLRRFCRVHGADYGCITCDDISWSFCYGVFSRLS